MVESQPDHNSDIQNFQQWARDARCVTSGGDTRDELTQSFIPNPKLESYLRVPRRVRSLLEALFPGNELPVEPEEVRKKYSKVFVILLLIGKGRYIENFVGRDSLCDQHLPFESKPSAFPIESTDPHFFKKFHDIQWELCAPYFDDATNKQFEPNEILPIIHKEKLAGGGNATIYKIKIHEAYNRLTLSDSSELADQGDRDRNTVVIKTYETKDAEQYFQNEAYAFKKLRAAGRDANIIGFHGSFTHNGTYNIILEYANQGTLERFYNTNDPPSSGEDIIKFWRSVFGVLKALMIIHNLPHDDPGRDQYLQGWHQDVKPANILVQGSSQSSPYDWKFKLGDLGLSHFNKKIVSQTDATRPDNHGTKTYGAPECCRFTESIEAYPLRVKQDVDVWSIGCVLSEAAIWVVRGRKDLLEYRRRRKMETEKFPMLKDSDCFHDGEKPLEAVRNLHRTLPQDCRASDHVTAAALEPTISQTLVESEGRVPVRVLYHRSKNILAEAQTKLGIAGVKRSSLSAMDNKKGWTDSPHDRPRTPPQVPDGYYQSQPRTPKRGNLMSHDYTSSPESVEFPQLENHYRKSIPTSPIKTTSNRWPRFSTNEEAISTRRGSHNRIVSEDENQSTDPFYDSNLPMQDDSHPRRHGKSMIGFTGGWQKDQLDSSPPTNPGADTTHLGRVPYIDKRNSKQGQIVGASAADLRNDKSEINRQPLSRPQSGHNSDPKENSRGLSLGQTLGDAPSANLANTAERNPPPILSVSSAKRWKSAKKNGEKPVLPNANLLDNLNDRDHVFLIDNSTSMRDYRREARDLFELLAYMVKEKDRDGIELYTTISNKREKSKDVSPLSKCLLSKTFEGNSNIRLELGNILRQYEARLKGTEQSKLWRRTKTAKALNLYIFTDGVWQPESDPAEMISDLMPILKHYKVYNEQFGIQFIRFGNDQDGKNRLERLDSGLNLSRDVIDTEPSNGNVWKMLLGAVNKWFDGDPVHTSPVSITSPLNSPVHTTNGFANDQYRTPP